MSCLATKRNTAKKLVRELCSEPKRALLIHYACEGFANRPDGSSARVTSIAVRHLDNALTHSFSIHLSAELLKIPYLDVSTHYEQLERHMLAEFSAFVTKHLSFSWVHWNMRDSNYGFPAIYHRCHLHDVTPPEIPPANLIDLARILSDIYGGKFIGHPKLETLMKRNKITDLGYIDGAGEATAFAKGEYVALHRSTLRKVHTFETILSRIDAKTLDTDYRWRDIYGQSPKDIIIYLKEHWGYTALAMCALAASLWRIFF